MLLFIYSDTNNIPGGQVQDAADMILPWTMRGSRQRWNSLTRVCSTNSSHLHKWMFSTCLNVNSNHFCLLVALKDPPFFYSGAAGACLHRESWNTCSSFLSSI